MNEEQKLKNLILELESAQDYDTRMALGQALTCFGDKAVEMIAPYFLQLNKPLHLLTQAEWQTKESYLLALETIGTRAAYQTLIEGMFVYDNGKMYWDDLLDIIDIHAKHMIEDLSEAALAACGRPILLMNLLLALTYGLESYSSLSQTVVDNILALYQQGELFAITYIYPVITGIIKQTQDMRFVQPSFRLLSRPESDLRWMAIVVLSAYDDEHIIMEITPMLEDENELVRLKAKEALVKAGFQEE